MTLVITTYCVKRDSDNTTKIFVVNVPEARQKGIGLQLRLFDHVCGVSFSTIERLLFNYGTR